MRYPKHLLRRCHRIFHFFYSDDSDIGKTYYPNADSSNSIDVYCAANTDHGDKIAEDYSKSMAFQETSSKMILTKSWNGTTHGKSK